MKEGEYSSDIESLSTEDALTPSSDIDNESDIYDEYDQSDQSDIAEKLVLQPALCVCCKTNFSEPSVYSRLLWFSSSQLKFIAKTLKIEFWSHEKYKSQQNLL